MIPAIDIYRTASLLMKRHGQDAPVEATIRAVGELCNLEADSLN